MKIIFACSEQDATAFLERVLASELDEAALVTTKTVGEALKSKGLVPSSETMEGVSSLKQVRERLASAGGRAVIVTGVDHGGVLYNKGFIRARVLAPWLLVGGERADLVLMGTGGAIRQSRPECTRTGLLLRIYPSAVGQLALRFAILVIVGTPMTLFTFFRLIIPLALVESRARVLSRKRRGESRSEIGI